MHELPPDEPVDAIGHRAAGDQGLLEELLRTQLKGGPGAAERRKDVPLPRFELASRKSFAACTVEVARQSVHSREDLKWREIKVRTLSTPGLNDAIDFVVLGGHPLIFASEGRAVVDTQFDLAESKGA